LLASDNVLLPEHWRTKRPEELTPSEFIDLTIAMYGEAESNGMMDREPIWRVPLNKGDKLFVDDDEDEE
jgi:hypothetical protein